MACDTCFPEQKQRMADRDSIRGQALQLATETGSPVAIVLQEDGSNGVRTFEEAITNRLTIVQVISA